MNILGKWSVTSFMTIIVQAFWAFLLLASILAGLNIVLNFSGYVSFGLEFPVWVQPGERAIALDQLPRGLVLEQEPTPASFHIINDTHTDHSLSWPLAGMQLLQLGGLLMMLWGLTKLKLILYSMREESPFTPLNARRLRIISLLVLSGGPLRYGYDWLSMHLFHAAAGSGIPLADPRFQPLYIWIGLLLLIISEVFRIGTKMYEEQKLTV